MKPLLFQKNSSFCVYVVLLRYPYLNNKQYTQTAMLMLPWKLLCLCYHGFLNSTTIYLFFLSVHLPFLKYFYFLLHFKGDFIMDNYLNSFREMISLRGLTDHTLKNYCTYIRAYLDYLSTCLHKLPEDVSWPELRDYIRWLQNSRNLSDRTINCAISQLRFFTLYVLHKPWDDTQLPMRRFDEYLPFVPSKQEVSILIDSMPDLKQKAMVALMLSSLLD